MALHNLKITVIDGGKSTGATAAGDMVADTGAKKSSGKKSNLYKFLNLNQAIKGKIRQAVSPTTFFALQAGVNLAQQTGRQFINYYVSDIGRRQGDSNYQAIINRRIEQVTDPLSIAGGAAVGAAAGSMFGPIGAGIGAIIGAAGAAVSLGFKYAERDRAYQHEMFKENNSQAYQLSRANFSALTGRLR